MPSEEAVLQSAIKDDIRLRDWRYDVFLFARDMFNVLPAQPLDELRGREFNTRDQYGAVRTVVLFDKHGRLVHHDLSFYRKEMFKHQSKREFREHCLDKRFTWQQTVELEAYNRALSTFGHDTFDIRKRWITIRSGHGIGKCLGYNTPILMYDGSVKSVQDVVVGDEIMGDDNTPRTILSLARGREQMYRVKYRDGSHYDVNESHILSLVSTQTHGKQKVGAITDVSVREYLTWSDRKKRTNVGYKRAIELPKQKLPIDPYLFGLWLGDGCSTSGYIYNTDEEIKEYLRGAGIGREHIDPRTGCWQATVLGLKQKLAAIGVLGDKHIPSVYLMSSRKQRLALLAGLIDTDGSLDKGRRQLDFVQKSKKLAEQVKWLAQSVGMHATLKEVRKSSQNGTVGTYFRLNISRNTEIVPVRLARKRAKRIGNEQRDNLHFAFSIEKLGVDDYYGFEIDGNKRFMLGDFTVTHNTSFASVVGIHFLMCFYNAQIGATANTDMQLKEVFLKEFYKWKKRMPKEFGEQIIELDDKIKIKGTKDWFLRARVAGKDNPEALAGIHGEHVLLFLDEASGVGEMMAQTMEGALTGDNWIVIMTGNPTRNEGFFFDSHKKGAPYTQLHFDSRDSPIVKDGYIESIVEKYGRESDVYKIRVSGEFVGVAEMDEKGWIPLFANINVLCEPYNGQIIRGGILGVDPAGQGRDRSIVMIRDAVYLKELLKEETSGDRDLARKIETLRDAYGVSSNDIGIDAFGLGAKVVANITTKTGETVNALLCDKPREEVKDQYASYKAELAWKFREWVSRGGIIITNNQREWLRELALIKYKRDPRGRITLMPKTEFRKEYGFSPDRFDACCYTFFRDEPSRAVVYTKQDLELKEVQDMIARIQAQKEIDYSQMSSM